MIIKQFHYAHDNNYRFQEFIVAGFGIVSLKWSESKGKWFVFEIDRSYADMPF